jgi:hypothetical protein
MAAAGHYHRVRPLGAARLVVPRSLFGRLARVARQDSHGWDPPRFGAPLFGRPSPLGAKNAMGPGEPQQRLPEEETIHQFQGPLSEGHGAVFDGPGRHREGLNYGLLSTTGRRALCQRIGRDAFPEKVWEAKLTSNVAGLTINSPTKLTFLK